MVSYDCSIFDYFLKQPIFHCYKLVYPSQQAHYGKQESCFEGNFMLFQTTPAASFLSFH